MIKIDSGLMAKAVPLFVVLLLTAGCVGILSGENLHNTPEEGANGGTPEMSPDDMVIDGSDRVQPGISFGSTERRTEDSGVVMEGNFRLTLMPEDDRTFDGVVVCWYDETGTVLHKDTTTLSGPVEWMNFSMRATELPVYLIVDHPEFSTIEEFDNSYLVIEDRGSSIIADRRYTFSDLPFDYSHPDRPGECG